MSTTDDIIVQAENVCFAYDPRTPVLVNVSFSLRRNESGCLLGPNGGGKTTLLNLILGLLTPDAGRLSVFGRSPREARRRVGYMPQHFRFDPHFPVSVLEVVLMGRLDRLRWGAYPRAEKEAARNALREVGTADLADRPFSTLSGGQRQRVLIARALACEPELLLLDEPTASIDPGAQDQFFNILQELNKRMAILVVSHDLGFVSDRIRKILCVNRTVRVHPSSEVTGEVIRELYGDRLRLVRHDRCLHEEGGAHG